MAKSTLTLYEALAMSLFVYAGVSQLAALPLIAAGGGWFVPLDAMVTHRFTQNLVVALGASKQLLQTYPQYNWTAYGKVSFNF